MAIEFEWDPDKAESNRRKHGVSSPEATTIFGDPLSLTVPDPSHSLAEERYLTVGLSHQSRLLMVVHQDHNDTIRIVSARLAKPAERRDYERS